MWSNLTKKLVHIAEDITTPQYDDEDDDADLRRQQQRQRRDIVAAGATRLTPSLREHVITSDTSSLPRRVGGDDDEEVVRSLSRDLRHSADTTPASVPPPPTETIVVEGEREVENRKFVVATVQGEVVSPPIRGPPAARLPVSSAPLAVSPAHTAAPSEAVREVDTSVKPLTLSSSPGTTVIGNTGSSKEADVAAIPEPSHAAVADHAPTMSEEVKPDVEKASPTRSSSDTHDDDNGEHIHSSSGNDDESRRYESETRRLAELETLRALMRQLEHDKQDEAARQQARYIALEEQHQRALTQLTQEWQQRLQQDVSAVEQRVRRECAEAAAAASQPKNTTHHKDEDVAKMKEMYEKRLTEANAAAAAQAAQHQTSLTALQKRLTSVEAERDGLVERVRLLEQAKTNSESQCDALRQSAAALREELERTQAALLQAHEHEAHLSKAQRDNSDESDEASAKLAEMTRKEAQWRSEKAELARQKNELDEKLSHYEELVHQLQHTITDCLQRADVALPQHTTRRRRRTSGLNSNGGGEEDNEGDEDDRGSNASVRTSSTSTTTTTTTNKKTGNSNSAAPSRDERTHGLTFSDLVIVLTSEFSRQRAVLRKAERVQHEWENTYAQARTVNQTLQQQVNEAWRTIGTLREESSVKDALIDKLQEERKASEQVQAAEQEKLAEVVNEVRALQEEREAWALRVDAAVESATTQLATLHALQDENAQLKATLQDRDDELATAHRSLENLQQVLQTFKERRKAAIEETTMDLQAEIDELKAQLARLAPLREQCEERLEQQRVQHAKELASRNIELTALHRKLAELRRALEVSARQLNGETMIDKTVVSHLLVSYIQAFVGQKKEADEVLKVMSGLLNWDEALQERAGLLPGPSNPRPGQQQRQRTARGGSGGGLLHWMRRPQTTSNTSSSGGAAVSNASLASSTQPGTERASLATLWVEFLLRESERGSGNSSSEPKRSGDSAVVEDTPALAALSTSGLNTSKSDTSGAAHEETVARVVAAPSPPVMQDDA